MAKRERRSEELPHLPLHLLLCGAVLVTIYPILWVVTIAFSGRQSLALADLPPDPTTADRLRATVPWPTRWSLSNFESVFTDQPFLRWILNSAAISLATTVLGVFLACTAAYAFSRFSRADLTLLRVPRVFTGGGG